MSVHCWTRDEHWKMVNHTTSGIIISDVVQLKRFTMSTLVPNFSAVVTNTIMYITVCVGTVHLCSQDACHEVDDMIIYYK